MQVLLAQTKIFSWPSCPTFYPTGRPVREADISFPYTAKDKTLRNYLRALYVLSWRGNLAEAPIFYVPLSDNLGLRTKPPPTNVGEIRASLNSRLRSDRYQTVAFAIFNVIFGFALYNC